MKTLVIYGTKYGYSKRCATILSEKLSGDTDLLNIAQLKSIILADYERVVIGGSIYIGTIQKAIKEFCQSNIVELKEKKLGLFICCMRDGEDAQKELDSAFPAELLAKATVKANFGGEFVLKNMSFFDRFITKMVTKSDQDQQNHLDENIEKFARLMG